MCRQARNLTLPEAQLVEIRFINVLHYQSRRTHGAEAGLRAARASSIVSFAGAATMLEELAIPFPAMS